MLQSQSLIVLILIVLASVLLSACSNGPIDRSQTAECSRINSRIVQGNVPGAPDGNFLSKNRQQQNADQERARAKKLGCGEY